MQVETCSVVVKWLLAVSCNHTQFALHRSNLHMVPPPPCKLPPLAISPPPTRETVTSMFFYLTCIVLVSVAHLLYAWPSMA